MKEENQNVPTTPWTRTNLFARAAMNSELRPEVGTAQSHKRINDTSPRVADAGVSR
jgi:hypothetical protein